MAFLTVPELSVKYKASEDHLRRAVAGWIKSGELEEPVHFSRRGGGCNAREFDERVVAMLINVHRSENHCLEAFVNGYDEIMKVLVR